jgi:peptidoglycan/LPS O-acetylase OafA/YrhL
MSNLEKQSRLIELDVFRGIAALSVVIFHYTTHYDFLYKHSTPLAFDFAIGRYGVELFFMISGYVIFLTLDKTTTPQEFIVSRFSRLYPVYWVAVLLTYAITSLLLLPRYGVSLTDALINLSMIQELARVPHVDNVYWTLHRELGFYLLIGSLFYTAARKYIIHIIAAIIFANIFVLYFELLDKIPGLWHIYSALPIMQLHLFGLGMVLYLFHRDRIMNWQFYLMVTLCVVSASIAVDTTHSSIIALLFACIFLATRMQSRLFRYPYLLFLGEISYPLYLIHNNVGSATIYTLEKSGMSVFLSILLTMLLVIILATAMNKLIEKPGLKWLRSRFKKKMATPQYS